MDQIMNRSLWGQFGAAIDTLANAIDACPDDLWADDRWSYWYRVYHTLFWLDLYTHGAVEGFHPPEPFDLGELQRDVMPSRVYSKRELAEYLAYGRARCRAAVLGLTDESAKRVCRFPWREHVYIELVIYNMRHVQHHAAQLNLILREERDLAPRWVGRAAD